MEGLLDAHNYQDALELQSLNHSLFVLDQVIATEQLDDESSPSTHFDVTNRWLACNDDLSTLMLPTQHINLEFSAQSFGGNLRLAKQMVSTMLANFYTDFQILQESYDQQQWPLFQTLVHQLRGVVAYCGTPRLEAICLHLEQQLKKTLNTIIHTHTNSFIRPLYRQLLMEIKAIQYELSEIDPVVTSA